MTPLASEKTTAANVACNWPAHAGQSLRAPESRASYTIDVSWDAEASVWIAICDEIPIALECESLEALIGRVKIAVPDMLEHEHGITVPVELLFREVALTGG